MDFTSCTHRDEVECENCSNKEYLDCRWERKLLLRFFYTMFPLFGFGIGGVITGAVFTGAWWRLGVVSGYFALFFLMETRILCSHCPYYAEEGKILHCLANHGFIKYAKYHPGPMKGWEKTLLVSSFILFALTFPLAQIYDIIILTANKSTFGAPIIVAVSTLFALTIIATITAFAVLFTKICPHCVNFSCPWNSVPKKIVDAYLERNPVMKEAWQKNGYELGRE